MFIFFLWTVKVVFTKREPSDDTVFVMVFRTAFQKRGIRAHDRSRERPSSTKFMIGILRFLRLFKNTASGVFRMKILKY